MEPGVPFALLGAVQLLAIAAGVGLAAAAALRRSASGLVLAIGAVGIAGAEIATALRLGDSASDGLALVRGVGALLIAVGLVTGGLGRRNVPTSLYGVVVPLAATGGPATFAGAASLLAALAAVRARRDAVGLTTGLGLALWGAAAFVSVRADHGSGAADTVLALRGGGAVAVLIGLALLARSSLLSKVVGAILAGVLAMAVAAVGVVGNVVVSSYETQARQTVQDASAARTASLNDLGSGVVSTTVTHLATLCVATPADCRQFVESENPEISFVPPTVHDFLVSVSRSGATSDEAHRGVTLGAGSLLTFRSLPVVRAVLSATNGNTRRSVDPLLTTVHLTGSKDAVAVAGVVGVYPDNGRNTLATKVFVYGIVLDDAYVQSAIDVGGYGLFVLAGSPLAVVASSRNDRTAAQVLAIADRAHVGSGLPPGGITVRSQGTEPTVAVRPLLDAGGSPVAYLAVSRDATEALKAERDALRLLVITSLAALLLVAVLAIVLGRRTVEPVRRLTLAAERIAAGDLSVTTGVRTRDEVGTLATRFEAMTTSLAQLTGDLRDAAARLSTVLASMTDGLLATDADGVVTSVNRAALEMLGLDEIDVLGEPLTVVADVRDVNDTQLAEPSLRLRDEAAEVVRPDGSRVPVRVAVMPLQGVEGVVMVLRDTTREREVERMKTEFLSNVSHELRTPLTPIRGYAEILVGKPDLDSDKVTTFATTIRDEALKMNRVVDLLVDVAALEAGRVSVNPRTISARELLDVGIDSWQDRAPKRRKDFKRRVAVGLPALHVDPVWVGKALDELIDNAVKYTPVGTPIMLTAALSPDGSRVRVSVKDAGPGIPDEEQAGLFTSFEQVDGSATRKVGGLGLGLSFVRRLAEDAGFPLTVWSKVGRGAEFALDLPVSDEPLPPRRAAMRRGSRATPR
ncbi:MAG: two-component system, OmpR family, phosphate regulon sensor histidine kinase PhoR [Frankiales bacterium]|nr:two-component system, OmpR family, phosphate regulon sensor histidine kinase PhoR [Frankiales bacterium]